MLDSHESIEVPLIKDRNNGSTWSLTQLVHFDEEWTGAKLRLSQSEGIPTRPQEEKALYGETLWINQSRMAIPQILYRKMLAANLSRNRSGYRKRTGWGS